MTNKKERKAPGMTLQDWQDIFGPKEGKRYYKQNYSMDAALDDTAERARAMLNAKGINENAKAN